MTAELVREASDVSTPAARLSALLDECDHVRRKYAEIINGAWQIKPPAAYDQKWHARQDMFEEARAHLQNATHDQALADALAGNPNLSREDWVRALEIAPAAAIRNPLFKLLVVQRVRVIEQPHELLALGALARHANARPEDTEAPLALIELVCAGLPDHELLEMYGGNFGEHGHGMPETPANRYCWQGDELWDFRAIAIHRAGTAVTDCLQRVGEVRAMTALDLCDALGWHLGGFHENWKTYVQTVSFAPAGDTQFTYELITRRRDDDPGDKVVGWRGPEGVRWVCSPRPGFLKGLPCATHEVPAKLAKVVSRWTMDSGDDDYEVKYEDGLVTMVWQRADVNGLAELTGCRIDAPFPEAEVRRLELLFGRDSPLVSFAEDPTRAHCAECEEFAPSGTCGHCGAVREDDE
jgi:hypothetical protein